MTYARDTVLGQKLRVVRLVGQGGLGEVYEVEHLLTRHRRALKVLKAQWRSDSGLVERFLREASAAGHIGNPHIVETYDAGMLEDGSPYLLMELLEGQSLDVVLRWNGRLDVGVAGRLMMQVCGAVAAAHDAGIIHRDLKPENLFLLKRDGHHFVKVLDFGISKFDTGLTGHAKVTNTFTSLGTPLYMSPEQMRSSKDVDERSDVYALAVILYEAISGAPPFNAESFAELAAMVLRGEAKSLNVVAPEVPLELSRIVARAMAPDRQHRHPSVRALAEALEPFASSGVTSLTELPRRAEVWAERQEAAADAEVSGWGPTAPPRGAMAPTTSSAGELTEVPDRPKDDTPRRFGIAAVVVIALLSSVGVGAWAIRQGRGAGVPEVALEVADASVPSVRVDVADPPVPVVDAGQKVVGPGVTEFRLQPVTPRREQRLAGSPRNDQSVDAGAAHPANTGFATTQGLDAGSVESSGARQPLQAVREPVVGTRRPLEPRRFEPLVARRPLFQGLLSVACDDDCLVTLPGGADAIEGPFTLRRTAPGLIQVQGRTGGATAVFRVEFSSNDDIVKLFADTTKGTIVVVTGK